MHKWLHSSGDMVSYLIFNPQEKGYSHKSIQVGQISRYYVDLTPVRGVKIFQDVYFTLVFWSLGLCFVCR